MKPLDESYLEWLYSQVADPTVMDSSQTFWKLFKQLYSKEAIWLIPNDDNRLEDGKALRHEFANDRGIDIDDPSWMDLGCSVLELMVGLSRRLSYEDLLQREPHYWFWVLIKNIGLEGYTDKKRRRVAHVDDLLDRVLHREYESDGRGGFFPLEHPEHNQRDVELWYQLSAYVIEQNQN